MRILIAPDSFKGALSADRVCAAIEEGIRQALPYPEIQVVPMADGGEGTSAALMTMGGEKILAETVDIYGRPKSGFWVKWGNSALVEASVGSGYVAPQDRIRPAIETTSLGTGLLTRAAMAHPHVEEVFVALGGTGSTDGGMGFLQALGTKFYDPQGNQIEPIGFNLGRVAKMEPVSLSKPLIGLYDVRSALIGEHGAVKMFGPQKGLETDRLVDYDEMMSHFGRIVAQRVGLGLADQDGAGAAGGIGFGILAAGGRLVPGAEQVASWVDLDGLIAASDAVITGEGRIDEQTLQGKCVGTVARHCAGHQKPLVALVGSRAPGLSGLYQNGVSLIYPIVPGPMTLDDAIQQTYQLVADAAFQIGKMLGALSFQSNP